MKQEYANPWPDLVTGSCAGLAKGGWDEEMRAIRGLEVAYARIWLNTAWQN